MKIISRIKKGHKHLRGNITANDYGNCMLEGLAIILILGVVVIGFVSWTFNVLMLRSVIAFLVILAWMYYGVGARYEK